MFNHDEEINYEKNKLFQNDISTFFHPLIWLTLAWNRAMRRYVRNAAKIKPRNAERYKL